MASKWGGLLFFFAISSLSIYSITRGGFSLNTNKDWLTLAGAVGSLLFTVGSAHSITKDERVQGYARMIAVMVKIVSALPFALAAALAVIWGIFYAFEWVRSIPVWAAVIIAILLIKR